MLESYPPDLRDFVIQKIANGSFRSADEFAIEAASLYRDLESRHINLQLKVAAGIKNIDDADFHEIADAKSLQTFFEGVKSRGQRSLGDSAGAK